MFSNAIRTALGSNWENPLQAGQGALPSAFAVTDLATESIGAAGSEVAQLVGLDIPVRVDRSLASAWFATTIEPLNFEVSPSWDSLAGNYRTSDGWIRLHTNAPHHRASALRVLGCRADRDAVTACVGAWPGESLETAVVEAGGCAAVSHTQAEWGNHPQGQAVGDEPLIDWSGDEHRWQPLNLTRPLAGLRVLDLTRILAGPVATRFLAGWGADVLRIDPVSWEEPSLAVEVTLGKRCARLDLRSEHEHFASLLDRADVIVHGYRPGALVGLGLGPFDGLVDVALDAYGWTGPWAGRRGFDSLVQMSTGIARAGTEAFASPRPTPLPVQALDHATGYLMAAAVVRALRGGPSRARLSLARTAALLVEAPGDPEATIAAPPPGQVEETKWGRLLRLPAPVSVGRLKMSWDRPACPLGSSPPTWDG